MMNYTSPTAFKIERRSRISKIISCSIMVIALASCGLHNPTNEARILTYEVSLKILNDEIPTYAKDYLNQKYGDSVQISYDNRGNIRMDYFGSGESGMDYTIYNAKKHILYAKWKNLDTTYFYDTHVNEYTLDSTERIDYIDGFALKYYSQHPTLEGIVVQEFHFMNDSLQVNADLYKDFIDFSFGAIINESKLLPVKTILTSTDLEITRKLITVKATKDPKKSFFTKDKSLPEKEY